MLRLIDQPDCNLLDYGCGDGTEFYSHFGFNWRRMRDWVSQYLKVDRTLFTPVGGLGGLVSSQAYRICIPIR